MPTSSIIDRCLGVIPGLESQGWQSCILHLPGDCGTARLLDPSGVLVGRFEAFNRVSTIPIDTD